MEELIKKFEELAATEAGWRVTLDNAKTLLSYLEAKKTLEYADVKPEAVRTARVTVALGDDADYAGALTVYEDAYKRHFIAAAARKAAEYRIEFGE